MADLDLDWYARRLLDTQDVRMGPLRRRDTPRPVDPLDVAAVLHGMADHTMNERLIREVVEGRALCPPGDPREEFRPEVTSLGRWFHRVADAIEWTAGEPLHDAVLVVRAGDLAGRHVGMRARLPGRLDPATGTWVETTAPITMVQHRRDGQVKVRRHPDSHVDHTLHPDTVLELTAP